MARTGSLRSLTKTDRPESSFVTVRRLLSYLLPYRSEVAIAIVWLVVASAATAAQPALTGRIIDAAVQAAASGDGPSVLAVPAMLLVSAAIVGWWTQRAQILRLGTAGQRALFELREEVFATVQRLSVSYFEAAESGDLMSRLINDIETLNSFLSQGFRRLLGAALGLVATLAGMLLVDWHLALVTLLAVPVMLAATRLFGYVARRAFRNRQEAIGKVSATLAEELATIKIAQAFNRTDTDRGGFAQRNAANREANVTASAVSSAFSPALGIISAIATALVTGFGGWLGVRGLVTIGVVVAFLGYARSFFNAVSQLSSLYADTQSALAGGERVFELLDTADEVADLPNARALAPVKGQVEFRGVCFAYRTGPQVLHDIDLVVEARTTVAVVGTTGAGKSTLLNLVPRFYDPTCGAVLVDGHDLRDVTMRSLRANLGIVMQDPFLFAATIADNIRYGREGASDEDVRAAARTARADDFIAQLPEGYGTIVEERGSTLSVGQRQLIALARAVLADPAILILDEATSSVDTRTEVLIQQALRALLAERTALIIAHRLSTVRNADRIVVIDEGRIVEDGTYASLLDAGGRFARLHNSQFAE
ncbi:MAG: ABC transporter ATP-binding protein [Coriobacteriia bacterium]|jgi:ATP-binding cassette subfamily B protein/subfamily B ATP-binding cassette protein MsbA|nr:ABC transporter ATP-binding protein [Coriobacteriia bacterium]